MTEQEDAINVKSDDGRKLIIQTSEGEEKTYYYSFIRTMYLQVETLEFATALSNYSFSLVPGVVPSESQAELKPYVRGVASLERGSISVIGAPSFNTERLSIAFRVRDEERAARYLAETNEENKGRLPHVFLGFNRADWEVGSDDEWYVECEVTQATFETLVNSIFTGNMQEMSIGLQLHDIYSDDNWSPPSAWSSWFLRPSKDDNRVKTPVSAQGEIASLILKLNTVDLKPKVNQLIEDEEERNPRLTDVEVPDAQAIAIQTLATNVEKLRGTVKWVGGFICSSRDLI